MRRIWWLLLCCGFAWTADSPLIIVSFDGFRWDYPDHVRTPNMDRVVAEGFRVKRMIPSYPSVTFPNHYTLVTGVHPSRHGLVANHIYDRATQCHYSLYRPETVAEPAWYQAKALWEVAGEHGLESASYFWVGSEMEGRQPNHFVVFDRNITVEQRLEQTARWLDPNASPTPRLILVYFSMLDDMGHRHGPDSPEIIDAIQEADGIIGRLLEIMAASGTSPNLLVVADHGMAPLSGEGILLDDIRRAIGPDQLEALKDSHSVVDLFIVDHDPENIEKVRARLPHPPYVTWYTRADHPRDLHPTRQGDIVGVLESGYQFLSGSKAKRGGGHGFDEFSKDMGAVCFGMGPAFKRGARLERVFSVDVFPLALRVLGLPQRPVDGHLDVWNPILNSDWATPIREEK